MTRSPEVCSASTTWCPTMPLAPAIATVRDSSALGLVVIVSCLVVIVSYRNAARKPRGFSQGMNGLPLDGTRTHVLSNQAGETAKLAGETHSPHKPYTG